MGAESSILEEVTFDDPISSPSGSSDWLVYPAVKKDGSKLTVFVREKDKQGDIKKFENAGKHLKLLRHPNILKFLGCVDTNESLYLLTEEVLPLECVIDDLTAQEISAGLYNLVEAMSFLHEQGGLCHNNLCVSSIFVCPDGSWKLGGMEYLCKFDQATPTFLKSCANGRNATVLSPEEKDGKYKIVKELGHARDAYAFGILAEGLLESMSSLGDMCKTFELRIQDEFLNKDPSQRPQISSLLEDRLFKNDYVQIISFLKNVTLHTEQEKKEFFRDLIQKLLSLPEELVALRLVRPLLARFVLLDPTAVYFLIPHILSPRSEDDEPRYTAENICPLLPENLFRKYVIPEIFKIFHVRDLHVRKVLLRNFGAYVHLFDKKTLESFILPQILLGLRDSNDELVQASLHAVADLVPLLGGDVVIGANRIRLFSEGMPKVIIGRSHYPKDLNETMAIPGISQNNKSSESIHDHKPKLKDLAKQAAREIRREEAKRKNEDKKKRLEMKKLSNKVQKINNNLKGSSEQVSDKAKGNSISLKNHSIQTYVTPEHSEPNNSWEEWEEEGSHDVDIDQADIWSAASRDEIEDEIETELNAMESTLSETQRARVSSPAEEGSPISSTTQDRLLSSQGNNPDRKTSGMKLSAARKTKQSPPPSAKLKQANWADMTSTNTDDRWNSQGEWEQEWSHNSDLDNYYQSSKSSVVQNITPTKIAKKPLGSEFDIMALDIKTSKSSFEVDFFADMQPNLQRPLESDAKDESKTASKSGFAMFAAAQNLEEDTGDWGDDLEWATEDTDDKS